MKINYIANILLPSEYAHTIQIVKMCEAFVQNSVDIELIIPDRFNPVKESVQNYYNLRSKNFSVKRIKCLDLSPEGSSRFVYLVRKYSFLFFTKIHLLFNKDLIYTREIIFPLFFKNSILELHALPKNINFLYSLSLKKTKILVVLTSFIKDKLINYGINPNKIIVCPDSVDIELFSKKEVFSNNPPNLFKNSETIIGYVGALKTMGMDKGISDFLNLLKILDFRFNALIVGGEKHHVDFYRNISNHLGLKDRVYFTGKVPHKEVAKYMKLCDILIAPFPENEHFSYYMSPLKIFEYMASLVPILTTDLPSIREVLTDGVNAVLARPGDIESIKQGVLKIANNKEFAKKISENAFFEVKEKYTWKKRAQNILNFINENSSNNSNI